MSVMYIIIGIKHFTDLNFFMAIMPPYIPFHKELIYISGFFEVLFGLLLLFNKTRKIASWGIIILLICVFPANIYLYCSDEAREILKITKDQALIRMPFQIPLILIAYWHSSNNDNYKLTLLNIAIFIPTIIYFITL
tara:strand:- start:533 stop:943 length:411 start_codon:yes stop_codon:yes gene_type:complete